MKPARFCVCLAALAVTACAAPQPLRTASGPESRGRQCFRANQVYGFTPGPDGYVDVATGEGPFRLKLGPGCPDFSWIMQIGVRPMESSWLCEGKNDRLITAQPAPANLCTVSEIQSLNREPLPQG